MVHDGSTAINTAAVHVPGIVFYYGSVALMWLLLLPVRCGVHLSTVRTAVSTAVTSIASTWRRPTSEKKGGASRPASCDFLLARASVLARILSLIHGGHTSHMQYERVLENSGHRYVSFSNQSLPSEWIQSPDLQASTMPFFVILEIGVPGEG